MLRTTAALVGACLFTLPVMAFAAPSTPDQAAFRELYEELVETNTTLSQGSCTLAAERMAARLQAAGMDAGNLHVLTDPEHPKEGSLVAVYPGDDAEAGAVLLLAHIDVVEADPADWERDPFTLLEEDGYFHARGAIDDKAMAAIWVDTLARFARAGHRPRKTVKVALTCGEESNGAFNGAEWLTAERRELIDADFALNEGGGGRVDAHGKVVQQVMQVGEKTFANYRLEVRNPGGHSSAPRPDNAIYTLAKALLNIESLEFPVEFNDVTRESFIEGSKTRGGEMGEAMAALVRDPGNTTADAIVATDPFLRSNSRTTCVATLVEAGHAANALAQRATANVNCRIFPGHSAEEIRAELERAIKDGDVAVTTLPPLRPAVAPPPLSPAVVDPIRAMVAKHFPDAAFGTTMINGYTDSTFLTAAGIPAYGVPGLWSGPDGSGAHGVNERVPVRSVYAGRDFLYDLVRAYVD